MSEPRIEHAAQADALVTDVRLCDPDALELRIRLPLSLAARSESLAKLAECSGGAVLTFPSGDILLWLGAISRPEHLHALRSHQLATVLKVCLRETCGSAYALYNSLCARLRRLLCKEGGNSGVAAERDAHLSSVCTNN